MLNAGWLRGHWELRRLVVWAGLPGIVAIFLIMGSCLVAMQTWRMQGETSRLQSEFTQRATLPKALPPAPVPDAAALAYFYDYLPAASTLPQVVNRLLAVGQRTGVVLQSGDYRIEDTGQGFVRYQIALPIKGDNQRVLDFVWQSLLVMPALAVESVSFQRESAITAQGEAEVRFVLFARTSVAQSSARRAGS